MCAFLSVSIEYGPYSKKRPLPGTRYENWNWNWGMKELFHWNDDRILDQVKNVC